MHRRTIVLAASASLVLPHAARAGGLASLSNADATRGLKAALETGALAAVRLLGVQDGFLGNPKVRIPLPGALQDASKLLKAMGQGRQVDELELAINRAAENAVPLAKNLLVNAVRNMSVTDAKNILTGGDTSVTEFFAGKTRAPLSGQFLPVVKQATSRAGLAAKYDRVAGKAVGFGLVKQEDASIDHYVTRKALDGLYLVIGEEEQKIRRDPVGTGSSILSKVFGAIR
ncbi:DUF4197 domain-containing protein [Ramlibacter tataouinensis]|uniref:DUF4197 domain-containing protein n=1 Tax=Ramlibacter tataouinensis TaxID=94132 RepID=UPI0022F383FD|nr:DUF4197 domain-containing protein [Ramlibacter tataouinensis]WBY00168.1 DUF4197 domain-containing protein [Ramlibacter tataouinensis]